MAEAFNPGAPMAERLESALAADGWRLGAAGAWEKRIVGFAPPGSFSPDGARVVRLAICERGRWLERLDAWGGIQREIDLRDHAEPAGAIAAALADNPKRQSASQP